MSSSETWLVPRWARVLRLLVPVVALLYGLTLIPGVRGPEPKFVPWLEIGVGDGVIVVSALLCLARAYLIREARLTWVLLGVGPLLYACGDLFYYGYLAHLTAPPYPWFSDVLWLTLYPAFAVGLILLVRSTLTGARASSDWTD